MNKKYVIQAFELNLKGRFDVLHGYYGDSLFSIPAQIMSTQIKDELGITVSEQSIYTLKKRLKKIPAPDIDPVRTLPQSPAEQLPQKKESFLPSDMDPGTQVENALKELKGKKNPDFDFDGI
jgi:hypothetical protein